MIKNQNLKTTTENNAFTYIGSIIKFNGKFKTVLKK